MIYPEPKFIKIKGDEFDLSNISLKLSGFLEKYTFLIDKKSVFNTKKKIINVYKKELKEFHFYPVDISQNLIEEAYGIHISKEEVCLYSSSERGTYYAVLTLSTILKNEKIHEIYLFDYPSFKVRGIIEGYYGNPWSMEDRIDAINYISRHKMNTYVYAPKDDVYLRDKWYLLYDKISIKSILNLYNVCVKNNIVFYYTISPGLTMKYSSNTLLKKLINKLSQIYEAGVKNFGLLLDDIPKELMYEEDRQVFPSLASAQGYLINKVYAALKKMDNQCNLLICPTIYHGIGDEDYIINLCNEIPDDVEVLWTGREICSSMINSHDSKYFYENTRHKPFYWDNYPVNDAGMINEMHIGPISNRSKDLNMFSNGFISNVMEYKESSMIPIGTICDYLWNSSGYDKNKSLKAAVNETAGSEYSVDFLSYIRCCNKSCINVDGNEEFTNEMTKFKFSILIGQSDKAFREIERYFRKNLNSSINLMSMSNKKLLNENLKWIEKWKKFNEFALKALEYMKYMNAGKVTKEQADEIKKLYGELEGNPLEIMRFETRQMFNSLNIK